MIHISAAMRAKLYLAMLDALETSDRPATPEEAQRLALAQLVSNCTSDEGLFALHEAFRLADAFDYWLVDNGCDGALSFMLANVAKLVGGNRDIARAALRLLGARPTYEMEGDDWVTEPGSKCHSIRFPRDVLVAQIKAELAEAEGFAA